MIPTPSHPAITTPYGKAGSWSGGTHGGADFGSSGIGGATVVAPWGGTVIGVRNSGGSYGTTWGSSYGTHVVIDYDHLPDGSPGLWGILAHLQTVTVSVGSRVEAGQKIGTVNSTGNSTGNHCHAEVQSDEHWSSGNHRNPQPWFDAQPSGGTPPPASGWMFPAGHKVHAKYLKWHGHELNSDGVSDSIRAWQEMLNGISMAGGQELPVTGQWFEMTAGETQLHQRLFIPPEDTPIEAVFVGPQQFEKAKGQTNCPYVWGG